ncbi:MAG: DNA alkylation repair protein [Porcipelethomonas sp.]
MTAKQVEEIIKGMPHKNSVYYKKLVPGAKPCYGVKVPELRKLARKIAKENYREFLDSSQFLSFESEMLHAFVIGYASDDIETILGYFMDFVPCVHDWSVSDALCQTFTISRKYPERVFAALTELSGSRNEFEVRVVAVTLMSHFLNDVYIDRVISVLDNLHTEKYYAQMGVAWAVATVMAKFPDRCTEYMKPGNNNLDKFTYNKAIQKMTESYRVTDEIKEMMKKLKISG